MIERIETDPVRLSHGRWNPATEQYTREGDIIASYSGDTIGMAGRVRRPFSLNSAFWIATSVGPYCVTAYRLTPAEAFDGAATTYPEKTASDGGESARNDPNGFYHGMKVTFRGNAFVLCGPPVAITPSQAPPPLTQGLLFDL